MKLTAEHSDYTPIDMITAKCGYCDKHKLCEVLMNNKGEKINLCEKCME